MHSGTKSKANRPPEKHNHTGTNMNNETLEKKGSIKPGRTRYKSVTSMLQQDGANDDMIRDVTALFRESRITRQLVALRTAAGLTQDQLAEKMGCSQGCISKKESGLDSELDIETLRAYSLHTGKHICINIGKPMNHVERIKMHAFGIRDSMRDLAKLAHKDEQLEQSIQAFFGEAMLNIVSLLAECQNEMPHPEDIEVVMNGSNHAPCLSPPTTSKSISLGDLVAAY
jgi:transcriptional regulator with XRE-family HTH domain